MSDCLEIAALVMFAACILMTMKMANDEVGRQHARHDKTDKFSD